MDNYKYLSELLARSVSSISKTSYESTKTLAENIAKTLEDFSTSTASYYLAMSEQISEVTSHLSELCQSIISSIEIPSISTESLEFLKNIDYQTGYIELNEDNCDSINTLLESSDASNDVSKKISKGKLSITDFIKTVLIPILAILLPMMQNSYYQKLNTIESQKTHAEELKLQERELDIREQEFQNEILQSQNEQEYYEQMLQMLTEIQDSLDQLQESQESYPCNHSDAPTLQNEESTDTPDVQFQDDSAE